ncbi:MAG: 3-dehydroquinate synthase [Candidatus Omnitrophica bacterium]|nr:3-dehydroquinate synthase [Candidatus Omnitrophota bacterium]
MNQIFVKSLRGDYRILVGEHLLEEAGSILKTLGLKGKILIVTQERVARFHLNPVEKSLRNAGFRLGVHRVADGEVAKSPRELERLYNTLVHHGFERRDTILALGGGVVGDLAGFAASSYLRGVLFVNAGTTLLAQVDSSIGGKTGINLEAGKNLVGAFYPPRLVISDVGVLATLSERELTSSMGEAVKYGVIRDVRLFRLLEKEGEKVFDKDPAFFKKIVLASARIKAAVVSRDEFEIKGERMILNFGHTFGHAFEQALHYRKLMHGEAVAVGMACAARLAVHLRICSPACEGRLCALLQKLHLPVSLSGLDLETARILEAMTYDKKKRGGDLRFVLPTRIGQVVIRDRIPRHLVKKVIHESGGIP